MSPRFRAFLTDFSTWLGAVFAGLSIGWKDLFNQFSSISQPFYATLAQWNIEPAMVHWAISGLFALACVFALLSALARRSVLLQPKRFIVSADDPRHLLGREDKVKALAGTCAKNSLAILKGESGAGKSALVKAGLLPYLNPNPEQHSALLPLLIDASSLDWNGGLRAELAQALARWPDEWRRLLGDSAKPATADKLFARLAGLPEHAPKRLLLVLDQIDDYFAAHREYFLDAAGVVATPANVESANSDWAALADLVRHKRIHLLLVCRKDEDMLSALHFKPEPSYFPLARIDAQLISPLLDEITRPDEQGTVVDAPDAGWLQLKTRLLNDLAEDGQILPVRLALALDSLRGFRYLTLAQYSKHGGARGLERLYVEKQLRDAKHALGYEPAAVLRALALLAEEDGSKTRRASLADFAAALSNSPHPVKDATPLLDFLEQNRLLRRQSGQNGEILLLYHDYLARGVRDAYKQAHRWTELLRTKSKEFDDAITWRQRWSALLSFSEQLSLCLARLRGRFNFGVYRRLAGWSLLRDLPVLLIVALLVVAAGWIDAIQQEQRAAEILSRIHDDRGIEQDEAAAWRDLAKAGEHARFHAMQQVVSNPPILARFKDKTTVLFHTVLGFDPRGRFSEEIGAAVFLPAARRADLKSEDFANIVKLSVRLHLPIGSPIFKALAQTTINRIKTEQDSDELRSLVDVLAVLRGKLDVKDAKLFAKTLVGLIVTHRNFRELDEHLAVTLGGDFEVEDLRPAIEKIKDPELDDYSLAKGSQMLAALGSKIEADKLRPVAETLVKRMKTKLRDYDYVELSQALAALSNKLDAADLKPGVDSLAKRIKAENSQQSLEKLAQVLAALGSKLNADDLRPGVQALVERMKAKDSYQDFVKISEALAALDSKIEAADLKPLAEDLVVRIKTEPKNGYLEWIAMAIVPLGDKFDAPDTMLLAEALTGRMKTEQHGNVLASLGQALATLGGKLDGKYLSIGAERLAERMNTGLDYTSLARFGRALNALVGKLEVKDAKPLAEAVIERMKTEQRGYALVSQGEALAALGLKLDAADLRPGAEALTKHIKSEDYYPRELEDFSRVLAALGGKLDAADLRPAAKVLVSNMKTETNSEVLAKRGQALAALGVKLEAEDLKPGMDVLAIRLRTDKGNVFYLATPWAAMEPIVNAHKDPKARIAEYVALLRDPLAVDGPEQFFYAQFLFDPSTYGSPHKALLEGLGKLTGQDFHGNLWQFVDWAQTEEGRKLVPSLE